MFSQNIPQSDLKTKSVLNKSNVNLAAVKLNLYVNTILFDVYLNGYIFRFFFLILVGDEI